MAINSNREIGRLYEIHGSVAKAYLTVASKDSIHLTSDRMERIGIVGQHVIIPCGLSKIVGRISCLSAEDPSFRLKEKSRLPAFPEFVQTLDIDLLGTIH